MAFRNATDKLTVEIANLNIFNQIEIRTARGIWKPLSTEPDRLLCVQVPQRVFRCLVNYVGWRVGQLLRARHAVQSLAKYPGRRVAPKRFGTQFFNALWISREGKAQVVEQKSTTHQESFQGRDREFLSRELGRDMPKGVRVGDIMDRKMFD